MLGKSMEESKKMDSANVLNDDLTTWTMNRKAVAIAAIHHVSLHR